MQIVFSEIWNLLVCAGDRDEQLQRSQIPLWHLSLIFRLKFLSLVLHLRLYNSGGFTASVLITSIIVLSPTFSLSLSHFGTLIDMTCKVSRAHRPIVASECYEQGAQHLLDSSYSGKSRLCE